MQRNDLPTHRHSAPFEVEWHRDGARVAPTRNVAVRRIDEYTSLLGISYLETDHAGNYSCVASNAVATFSKSAVLTIRVPPEWISKPKDAEAVEGEDVFFPCSVSGVPEPLITWRKMADANSRHPLLELNLQRPVYRNYRLLMNGTLYIHKVEEGDEGRYLCEAENGVNDPLAAVVNLKVNAPPKFDVAHAGPVTGRTSEAMELVCEAVGDDHIRIKWKKDGREYLTEPGKSSTTEIRELDRVTSKLRIGDSAQSDAGRYSCEAENAYGKSHFSIDVTIWEPPPTPGNLSILEISSRSVKVSWTIEAASPRVERLVVQWKERSENWFPEGKQKILPGQMGESVVTGMRPWAVYQLRVFAENQLGKSKEGKVLQFVTNGERPGGPPRTVRITALSSSSLEVTWDDPERVLRHGPVARYNIGYREYSSQNYRFLDVDKFDHSGDGSRFVLARLRKHCQYEVVIQAINAFGEGPLTKPSLGRTMEDVPDGPPEKAHCVALTSSTIQVSWHPPEIHLRNGIIKGYKVLYAPRPRAAPSAGLPVQPKISRLSTVTTVLENLLKYSNYSIQVLAFTGAGDGLYSVPIDCATHSDVPGPPGGIRASVRSSASIVVSWLPPDLANGVVQRYHVYVRETPSDGRTHTKFNREASVTSMTVDDLISGRQYQFWVTAVTAVGEGKSSNVVTQTPTDRVPARATSLGRTVYLPLGSPLALPCRYVGSPAPEKKWFKDGREIDWTRNSGGGRSVFGFESDLEVESVGRENGGNYTCTVDNTFGSDRVTYVVMVQVPPSPPSVNVVQTSPDSVTLRWRVISDGNSPVVKAVINYKMTHGEWLSAQIGWHQSEHTLSGLHCGREYNAYVVLVNALGLASPTSEVLNVRTQGDRPSGPPASDFVSANTSYVVLHLDKWDDHRCDILYFVVEYKRHAVDTWTTVTNDLLPQPRYSIRGLMSDTVYDLKITAHNHAGSTSLTYTAKTLPEGYSDAAHYGNGGNLGGGGGGGSAIGDQISNAFAGVGVRSALLVAVSALCLFLASVGVCVCLRKKHPTRGVVGGQMGYGEIPKAAAAAAVCGGGGGGVNGGGSGSDTLDAHRSNLDRILQQQHHQQQQQQQQLYATIQRKQPPVPPFSHNKGFDTIDRLKQQQQQPDICPYTGTFQQRQQHGNSNRNCATLGRQIKTLEMTEYQKQKLLDEANTVRIRESKEYTLSLGRNRRRRYSESEEYDTDTSGGGGGGDRITAGVVIGGVSGARSGGPGGVATTSSSARTSTESTSAAAAANRNAYDGLRYRQQFNL